MTFDSREVGGKQTETIKEEVAALRDAELRLGAGFDFLCGAADSGEWKTVKSGRKITSCREIKEKGGEGATVWKISKEEKDKGATIWHCFLQSKDSKDAALINFYSHTGGSEIRSPVKAENDKFARAEICFAEAKKTGDKQTAFIPLVVWDQEAGLIVEGSTKDSFERRKKVFEEMVDYFSKDEWMTAGFSKANNRRTLSKKAMAVAGTVLLIPLALSLACGSTVPSESLTPMATVVAQGTPTPLPENDIFSEVETNVRKATAEFTYSIIENGELKHAGYEGTAFFVKDDQGKWFLVTALHVLRLNIDSTFLYPDDPGFYQQGANRVINFYLSRPEDNTKLDYSSASGVFERAIYFPGAIDNIHAGVDVVVLPVAQPEKFSQFFQPLSLDEAGFQENETVLICGYTGRSEDNYASGFYRFEGVLRERGEWGTWWVDGRGWFGQSGGPIMGDTGFVKGIDQGGLEDIGKELIVSSDRIRELIDQYYNRGQ